MTARRVRIRPIALALAVGIALPAAVYGMLSWPATTRQGINFQVSTHTIPLYAKALAFLHRDAEYRVLARIVTHGLSTDRERAQAALAWTHAHIRPVPDGFPVVDDHILHIVIRGYGLADQRADVFAALCTYAGTPAFWRIVTLPDGGHALVSFVQLDGRWAIVDPLHDALLTDDRGEPVYVGDPEMADALAGALGPTGAVVASDLSARGLRIPRPLRAELQMPWPRLAHELRNLVGLTPRDGMAGTR